MLKKIDFYWQHRFLQNTTIFEARNGLLDKMRATFEQFLNQICFVEKIMKLS